MIQYQSILDLLSSDSSSKVSSSSGSLNTSSNDDWSDDESDPESDIDWEGEEAALGMGKSPHGNAEQIIQLGVKWLA